MGITLTHQQQAAVDDRGGELLVSAAAGSGKTRILVERLMNRVEQEHLDLDRFLVITYTKAAAAELRGKIMDELNARLANKPGDAFLRRQKLVIYRSQISTIHSFCTALLREEGYRIDLQPDFRVGDDSECAILQDRPRALPPWWTPYPLAGTTAGWPLLCWISMLEFKATRRPGAGWRTRRRPLICGASRTWEIPLGAVC